MKISFVTTALLATIATCSAIESSTVLHPGLISFHELENDELFERSGAKDILQGELRRTGIVQVGGIPAYKQLRSLVLRGAVKCSKVSASASSSVFEDGTTRVTIAGETRAGEGRIPIDVGEHSECEEFQSVLSAFRDTVSFVSRLFSSRLGEVLNLPEGSVLLSSAKNNFKSIEELTSEGYQLEHFRSYYWGPNSKYSIDDEDIPPTIDFHTDQGLFIAFVPPLMVDDEGQIVDSEPGKFFVSLSKEYVAEVSFADDGDVLVFMLGEEIYKILSPKLSSEDMPRAVPHALVMPRSASKAVHRSWYGRMFLPPQDAKTVSSDMTYGEFREKTIQASLNENARDSSEVLAVGCGKNQRARELAAVSCESNQIYCWHACMNFTETASPDACAAKNMGFNCTSAYDQIWIPAAGHGDFTPACTNASDLVTKSPTISPALESCPSLETVVDGLEFQNSMLLNPKVMLVWNVTSDGSLEASVVFDGRLGWVAIGFPKEGGGKKGMHGAKVVMGIAAVGGMSGHVAEYQVHEKMSGFRHWNKTLAKTIEKSSFQIDSCHAVMSFKTKEIQGSSFDVKGKNNLIWAAHDLTWRVEYHGRDLRGVVEVDFTKSSEMPSSALQLEGTAIAALLALYLMLRN